MPFTKYIHKTQLTDWLKAASNSKARFPRICALLLLAFALAIQGSGADADKPIQKGTDERINIALRECLDLVRTGQLDKVAAKLEPLRDKLKLHSYSLADAVACELALSDNQLEEAWKYTSMYAAIYPESTTENVEAQLAAGDTLLAYSSNKQAASLFDWIAAKTTGISQVLAAEGYGRSGLNMSQMDHAIESLQFALDEGRTLYNNQHQMDFILNRIQGELNQANRLSEIQKYGEDFVLYRDGERLRRQSSSFAEAITCYKKVAEKFPKGAFADASQLYQCICLEKLGRIDEADTKLQDFYSANKFGLYRGEALLELAHIALENRLDTDLTTKYCVLLSEWISQVRQRRPPRLAPIKPAAQELVAAPKFEKRRTRWGLIEPVPIIPGELVNESTCNWYLNSIEASCVKIHGFIYLVSGQSKLAMARFDRLLVLDPECAIERGNEMTACNDFTRLRWGAKHGFLYALPEELALFEGKQKLALLLGDFYLVVQDFSSAKSMYNQVAQGKLGTITKQMKEYPQLAYASCVYWSEGTDRGYEEYSKLFPVEGASLTQSRAMYYAASISQSGSSEKYRQDGFAILQKLIQSQTNDWSMQGRILYAEILIKQKKDKDGIALLKSVPQSAGDLKILADYLINKYTISLHRGN